MRKSSDKNMVISLLGCVTTSHRRKFIHFNFLFVYVSLITSFLVLMEFNIWFVHTFLTYHEDILIHKIYGYVIMFVVVTLFFTRKVLR